MCFTKRLAGYRTEKHKCKRYFLIYLVIQTNTKGFLQNILNKIRIPIFFLASFKKKLKKDYNKLKKKHRPKNPN